MKETIRFNDIPFMQEVKDKYVIARRRGQNRSAAVKTLCTEYKNELTIGRDDDNCFFWVALADVQVQYKELTEDIAQNGRNALNQLRINFSVDEKEVLKRENAYSEAPMPEHTFRKTRKYQCPWRIGDTFAYQLKSETAQKEGVAGKYVLIRKVDEQTEWDSEKIVPIVTLSLWNEEKLPCTTEEFQRAPLLKLSSGRFESPENLYEYRAEITINNKKQLSELNLEYIGNFCDVKLPTDEFIIKRAGDTMWILPKTFESNILALIRVDQYYRARGNC